MKLYTTLDEVEEVIEKKSFIIDNTYINNYNRISLIEKLFIFCSIITIIIAISINIIEAIKVANSLYPLLAQDNYDDKFIPFIRLFYIFFGVSFAAIRIYLAIIKKKIINECFRMKYYICINELKRFNNYKYLKEDEVEKILNERMYKAADIVVK